jgi:transposase
MPWKDCSVMDERVRFVAQLLEGEKMAALCREFAISRKTGYKICDRDKESGLEALTDRSSRPWRYCNQLPSQVETAVNLEQEKPHWGAHKIRERLLRRFSCEVKVPARSTIHVTNCGRICLHRKKINFSTVFAGQAVGIKEVGDGIWRLSFMDYDLGYIDLEEKTLQALENPFDPKV